MHSPLQEIREDWIKEKSIQLFLKRDDLLNPLDHPSDQDVELLYSGNKWRKLKFNLPQYLEQAETPILTFGGAFSNHLFALSSIAAHHKLACIGIVRGEESARSNPTLSHCIKHGMKLHFVSREEYRRRRQADYHTELHHKYGPFHLLPEGGSNPQALPGCSEITEEVREQLPFSHLCAPVGTGATLAGIIQALKKGEQALGFAALKGNFLNAEVAGFIKGGTQGDWSINKDHHFGGYAKHTPELLDFMRAFHNKQQIKLDPIYTGKMMFGIYELIRSNYFEKGSIVVAVHTGGLQGLAGFTERFGHSIYS